MGQPRPHFQFGLGHLLKAAVVTALFADGYRNGSALEIFLGWLTYSAVLIHAAAQLKTSALAFWLCVGFVVLPVVEGGSKWRRRAAEYGGAG